MKAQGTKISPLSTESRGGSTFMSQINKRNWDLNWPAGDISNVPYRVFADPAVFREEQERIFRGPTWSYVGLEAEIPNEGDYKTTYIGEVPVILSRDREGGIHVLVNRCAHRGALVLREAFGSKKRYNCVYHQWGYDPNGDLKAVPFKSGAGGGCGYDESFSLIITAISGLKRLVMTRRPSWPIIWFTEPKMMAILFCSARAESLLESCLRTSPSSLPKSLFMILIGFRIY